MIHDMQYFQKVIQIHQLMRDKLVVNDEINPADYHSEKATSLRRLWQPFSLVPFWILVWAKHQFRPKTPWPDVIVIYASSRTPRFPNETTTQFINRITRSNRGQSALTHLNIAPQAVVRPVTLLNGLTHPITAEEQDNALSFLLSLLRGWAIVRFIKDMYQSSGGWRIKVEMALILLLTRASENKPTHLVTTQSNSVLIELFRQAISGQAQHQVTEILHGIASTVMEPYYDFFEQHALSHILYINLIKDLPQFRSIERKTLCDTKGQIVINAQLNSSIPDSENRIFLDQELLAKRPILIIGGFSQGTDYLKSVFFDRECQVMRHLRAILPDQAILYSPHPQIGSENPKLNAVLAQHLIETISLSTLELIFHAQAAIGTFSTSVFEAALLDCPVLLLPFKDSLILPALLELPMITQVKTDAEIMPALDDLCQMAFASPTADFVKYADQCQRRLGVHLIHGALESKLTT